MNITNGFIGTLKESILSIFICVLHFRWGQFSIVAGDHDLSSNEGTEQTIDVDKVIMVRAILLYFSLTVKAAPHECVIRTGQP